MATNAKKSGSAKASAMRGRPARASRPAKKGGRPAGARMSLAEAMAALEAAGSEQTRKTYRRHGAQEPLFGVSFATLKSLLKRIGVDHELALALWDTGNFDARNLAVKIADPAKMTEADLDRWARSGCLWMCFSYVALLACEGPHGRSRAKAWLASSDETERAIGWSLVGSLASSDPSLPDSWFLERLSAIEKSIHAAPNVHREAMNRAVIEIGCRNEALRKAATAAAKRIGAVEIDYGDTACETRAAVPTIDKAWARAASKNFDSPAAQERARQPLRLRC